MVMNSTSEIFTHEDLLDGTAQTWLQGLTITTFHDAEVIPIGSAKVMYTIIYE